VSSNFFVRDFFLPEVFLVAIFASSPFFD